MPSSSTMANARSADGNDPLGEAQALIEAGRPDEAVDVLERWHARGRGGLLLQTMRVQALIAANDTPGALRVAREAAMLYPGAAAAAAALGEALLAQGMLAAAIGEFQRALRLDPDLSVVRYRLGCAWLEAGEAEKAAEAFDALPSETMPPGCAEKRAEIAAMRTRPRADARYIRHLFDQFSVDYDARMLSRLGYGAPQILRNLAELVGIAGQGEIAVLDLGCGTGLSGAAFSNLASRLDGIDLSPAMVAKARERGIYDDLRIGDIESSLNSDGRTYDVVVAADTLVYLGDLATLFRYVCDVLVVGGLFLFTVERNSGDGYALGPKRRWRHSESYLRTQAAVAGFDVVGFLECTPRTEAGRPVEGYAVALRKEVR